MGKTFIKLILAFLIILSSLAFVLWFTQGKMNILRKELNSRKSYDTEVVLINKLFINVENFYLISNQTGIETKTIQETQEELDPINSRINNTIFELKKSSIHKNYKEIIDSISVLYEDLANNTVELILLQKMAATSFDKPLLNALNNTTKILKQDSSFVKVNEPISISSKELRKIEQEKQKQARAEKRKQKKDPNYVAAAIAPEIAPDSSLFVKIDSALSQLSKAIIKEQTTINKRKGELEEKIYEIAINKHYIYQRINHLLGQLRSEEQEQLSVKINNASQYAEDALYWLFVIFITASVLAVIFISLIIYDISKSNYFKKKLIVEKNKAEKLAKDKETFLNRMNHEIRTPLNAIIGFSNLLTNEKLNEKELKYALQIQNSSSHLLNLVNETLDFTRIEGGYAIPKAEEFDSMKTIQEVVTELEILADKKQIELKTNLSPAKNTVVGDITWLKQIIYNIVGNSIKYTNEGHVQIDTSWELADTYKKIKITIKDTGVGISEEQIKSLFDVYKKDFRPSISSGSTGLGLPITKKIIELQKGTIHVTSKLGEGSTFIVEIPFKIGRPIEHYYEAQNNAKSSLTVPNLQQKKMLVIDDDLPSLMLLEILLTQWNADVTKASSTSEAIDQLSKQQFDTILTDWNLADKTAEEILQFVVQNEIKTPIIVVSADNKVKDYLSLYHHIQIKTTPKPISPINLASILS